MIETTKTFVRLHEIVLEKLHGRYKAEHLCEAINWTLSYKSSRQSDELVYLAEVRAKWIKELVDTDLSFSMREDGQFYT